MAAKDLDTSSARKSGATPAGRSAPASAPAFSSSAGEESFVVPVTALGAPVSAAP